MFESGGGIEESCFPFWIFVPNDKQNFPQTQETPSWSTFNLHNSPPLSISLLQIPAESEFHCLSYLYQPNTSIFFFAAANFAIISCELKEP
jgi:hypothetical protein